VELVDSARCLKAPTARYTKAEGRQIADAIHAEPIRFRA
jgi:hypothetical protein